MPFPPIPAPGARARRTLRSVAALVFVVAAALVRLGFLQTLGTRATFVTFYPAVMLAALYGGLPAGLLATALSAGLAAYFWMEPVGLAIQAPGDWLALAIFLVSGTMISGVTEAMHRAQARAREAEVQAGWAAAERREAEVLRKAHAELEIRIQKRTAELKSTTEELRQKSLHARSLLEASLDPLVTISPAGKITDVNEATEQATGVPRLTLIGSDFSNYFTEPDRAREGYQKVISDGYVRDYPLTIHHTSGRATDVLYNATVYRDGAGAVQGVFAAARDITERKRVEAELVRHREHLEELVFQRTEDLARSNRDLEQFAYVASHDLQEPLRAVGGFVGLLQQRYQGKLDEKADGYIHSAVDGVTRMQTLIGDLLSYSRVGTQGKAMEPTDTRESLNEALTNLHASIEESGAVIQVDPMPIIPADALQLTQLYQNLIANAIKFRSDRPPEIHVGARREQDAWLFWVRDNGIGIDAQYAERIFLIFQRLHTRKMYPGTGIGLAICKRIVERHGGSIWVESQPGQGSTFYFTLPDKGEHP
ncbi:MAG: ATP-binding protein [Phycisphaerae bacterium]|nr:ATP-binding protein [Phycisphaerae bacterium]